LKEAKKLAVESPKKDIQVTLKSPSKTPPKPKPVIVLPEPVLKATTVADLKPLKPPSPLAAAMGSGSTGGKGELFCVFLLMYDFVSITYLDRNF
jgi:hypothetical protein